MSRYTPDPLASLANQTSAIDTINDNFDAIKEAIDDTLSRVGDSPNTMESNLDMNSNRIVNLPLPVSNTEPVRKGEFDETIADLVIGELDAVDAGSLSVIVDGGTEERPLDEHIAKIGLTPKDYGATGGGSVNDTVAVQACYAAAIDLGRPVLIDDIYLVASAITIDGPVRTYGYGWGTSQLWLSSTTANLFEINTLTAPHFEDIQIVGANNGTASLKTAGAFFRVDGDCQFPTWRNCRFIFGFNTWNFDEANSWTIDSCFALGHANNGRGILLNNVGDIGSGEINISNSLIAGDNTARTGIGILHGGGVNVKIVNSEFYQWDDGYQFNGTEAGGTGSVYITNSVFSQCTRDIVLTKGSATSFTDLSILGNQLYGVNPIVQTGTGTPWLFNAVINNNMITPGITKFDASGTAGVGVALTSVATFTMTGNTFTATNSGADRAWTVGSDALDGVVSNNAYRGNILQGVSSAASGEVYVNDFRSSGVFNSGSTFYSYDATVLPASNGGAALGAATQAWSALNLSSGSTLNWNNGDVILTHSADTLTFSGMTTLVLGSAGLNMGATLNTGTGVTTGSASIELGGARTGDGNSFIDFHATSGTDNEFRIIRAGGVNGATSIINTGSGNLNIQNSGGALSFTGTSFVPSSNDLFALGTTALSFADLFLASGAVINFNNGNVTLTHSAGILGLTGAFTGTNISNTNRFISNTDAVTNIALRLESDRATPAAGDIVRLDFYTSDSVGTQTLMAGISGVGAAVTDSSELGRMLFGVATAGALTNYMRLDAGVLSPEVNDATALGNGTRMWSDLFLASGAVINFNNGDVTLTHAADTLTFAGASTGYIFDAPLQTTTLRLTTSNNLGYPSQWAYKITGVNFNSANTDNAIAITLPAGMTRYRIGGIEISGASASLSTSTWGLFTATGGGGTAIVAAGTANTITTASEGTTNNAMFTFPASGGTTTFNNSTLYFRVGTAQGSAATADVTLILNVF